MDMVLLRPDTPALADLDRHAARHHVARGEVLVGGRVALHEPLALGVGQVPALAARALGDQAAGAVDAGRVELDELHVLQRQALARRHAGAVAGAGMRRGRREIGAPVPAGGEHRHLGVEAVQLAVVERPGQHPLADAVLAHEEVDREVLDVELGLVLDRLAVERVQDRVPGPVGGGAGALHRRPLAELGRVPAERPLVDPPVLGARERHAVVLELVDRLRRLAGEILHRVGVAEPVRPLDGVVHVPLPAIRPHVAERCRDPALCGDGVRAGREDLGDAGRPQPLLGHAEGRAQPRPSGPDHDDVMGVVDELVCGHGWSLQAAKAILATAKMPVSAKAQQRKVLARSVAVRSGRSCT